MVFARKILQIAIQRLFWENNYINKMDLMRINQSKRHNDELCNFVLHY